MKGLYTLKTPFDNDLLANIAYECIAIRKLSDIVAAGGDPQAEYYTPKELTDDDYAADVAAGACIVTLRADEAHLIYVPDTYISEQPELGGIPYTQVMLGIDLGPLPDAQDLSTLKDLLAEVVLANLGQEATVHAAVISLPLVMSDAQHASLEAARTAAKTEPKTTYAKLLEAQATIQELQDKLAILEQYFVDNPPT
jgi:hypothetical protein